MSPAVSIILPVRDGAATLRRAIGSVLAQTRRDWELLVIDDGSTDGSAAVAQEVGDGDVRVRVMTQRPLGLVAALGEGLRRASADLVARLDADDEAHPERLAEQVEWLQRHPDVGLVSCLVRFGGDRQAHAGYARHVDWLNSVVSPEAIALNRFVESPLAHPSVCFRKALLERHGGYREGPFPEDYELWLRWLDAGVRMAKVPRELLVWHDRAERLSRRDPRYAPDAFYRVKAPYLAREVGRLAGGREVWIWGAGRPTRQRVRHLVAQGVVVAGFIDIDPKKAGRRVQDVPVVLPTDMPSPAMALVIGYVANPGARDLIRRQLAERGYVEGRDSLMAA